MIPTAGAARVPPRRRIDFINSGSGASEYTYSNAPHAFTEINPDRHRTYVDLTGVTQMRVTWGVTVVGTAGCILGFEYSLDDGGSWYKLDDGSVGGTAIGTHKPQCSLAATGTFVNPWFAVTAAARTSVLLRLVEEGGNGVYDPQISRLALEVF